MQEAATSLTDLPRDVLSAIITEVEHPEDVSAFVLTCRWAFILGQLPEVLASWLCRQSGLQHSPTSSSEERCAASIRLVRAVTARACTSPLAAHIISYAGPYPWSPYAGIAPVLIQWLLDWAASCGSLASPSRVDSCALQSKCIAPCEEQHQTTLTWALTLDDAAMRALALQTHGQTYVSAAASALSNAAASGQLWVVDALLPLMEELLIPDPLIHTPTRSRLATQHTAHASLNNGEQDDDPLGAVSALHQALSNGHLHVARALLSHVMPQGPGQDRAPSAPTATAAATAPRSTSAASSAVLASVANDRGHMPSSIILPGTDYLDAADVNPVLDAAASPQYLLQPPTRRLAAAAVHPPASTADQPASPSGALGATGSTGIGAPSSASAGAVSGTGAAATGSTGNTAGSNGNTAGGASTGSSLGSALRSFGRRSVSSSSIVWGWLTGSSKSPASTPPSISNHSSRSSSMDLPAGRGLAPAGNTGSTGAAATAATAAALLQHGGEGDSRLRRSRHWSRSITAPVLAVGQPALQAHTQAAQAVSPTTRGPTHAPPPSISPSGDFRTNTFRRHLTRYPSLSGGTPLSRTGSIPETPGRSGDQPAQRVLSRYGSSGRTTPLASWPKPLHDRAEELLVAAVRGGSPEGLALLLEPPPQGLGLHVQAGRDRALRTAAQLGATELVEVLADVWGADVRARDDEALRAAARRGDARTARVLIARGADVNVFSSEPLKSACMAGSMELVRLLLAKGASVVPEALIFASQEGHAALVKLLLSNYYNPQQAGEGSEAKEESGWSLPWGLMKKSNSTTKLNRLGSADTIPTGQGHIETEFTGRQTTSGVLLGAAADGPTGTGLPGSVMRHTRMSAGGCIGQGLTRAQSQGQYPSSGPLLPVGGSSSPLCSGSHQEVLLKALRAAQSGGHTLVESMLIKCYADAVMAA